jgi:hypothetical protein
MNQRNLLVANFVFELLPIPCIFLAVLAISN